MSLDLIKQLLEEEHSKKQTTFLVELILKNEIQLTSVFQIINGTNKKHTQRAAWIIGTLADVDVQKLNGFQNELSELVSKNIHDAVLRNCFRALAVMQIKEELQGVLFDSGINLLYRSSTATAVKTWIIEVLLKIAEPYAELQIELKTCLESQLKNASKGIKGKMTKVIQKINNNFNDPSEASNH